MLSTGWPNAAGESSLPRPGPTHGVIYRGDAMPTLDQQTILIILAVVAVIVVGVLIALALRRRKERNNRKAMLRERYGPEYDRAVVDSGNEREAVDELAQRDERHEALVLRDLDDVERDRVRAHIAELQYHFVDDPADALLESQQVVSEVLRVRGYPVETDREEGLRMLSVDHPMQTQPVRALLQGEYSDDVGDQRHLFLDVRAAVRDIADINLGRTDAGERRDRPASAAASGDTAPSHTAPSHTALGDTTLGDTTLGDAAPAAPAPAAPAPATAPVPRDTAQGEPAAGDPGMASGISGTSVTGSSPAGDRDGSAGARPTDETPEIEETEP